MSTDQEEIKKKYVWQLDIKTTSLKNDRDILTTDQPRRRCVNKHESATTKWFYTYPNRTTVNNHKGFFFNFLLPHWHLKHGFLNVCNCVFFFVISALLLQISKRHTLILYYKFRFYVQEFFCTIWKLLGTVKPIFLKFITSRIQYSLWSNNSREIRVLNKRSYYLFHSRTTNYEPELDSRLLALGPYVRRQSER